MSLLTGAEFDEIRSAIKEVTDTFFKTPVLYRVSKESLDTWQEDRPKEYTDYNLLALYETPDIDKSNNKENEGGYNDFGLIKLSFNLDDLEQAGLITAGIFKGKQTDDLIEVKGQKCTIEKIIYDGPLQPRDVLVIIYVKKLENEF